jgi:cytochrome P450
MCLGLHFAYMQVKILMAHLLTRYELSLEPGYAVPWAPWPIPKPTDGMRVRFTSLANRRESPRRRGPQRPG